MNWKRQKTCREIASEFTETEKQFKGFLFSSWHDLLCYSKTFRTWRAGLIYSKIYALVFDNRHQQLNRDRVIVGFFRFFGFITFIVLDPCLRFLSFPLWPHGFIALLFTHLTLRVQCSSYTRLVTLSKNPSWMRKLNKIKSYCAKEMRLFDGKHQPTKCL